MSKEKEEVKAEDIKVELPAQPIVNKGRKRAIRKGLSRFQTLLNLFIFSLYEASALIMPALLFIAQGINAVNTSSWLLQEFLSLKKIPRKQLLVSGSLTAGSLTAVGLQTVAVISYVVPALRFLAMPFFFASIALSAALSTVELIQRYKQRNETPLGMLKFQSALARTLFTYAATAAVATIMFVPGGFLIGVSILLAATTALAAFRMWKTIKRHRQRSKVAQAPEASEDIPVDTETLMPSKTLTENSTSSAQAGVTAKEVGIQTEVTQVEMTTQMKDTGRESTKALLSEPPVVRKPSSDSSGSFPETPNSVDIDTSVSTASTRSTSSDNVSEASAKHGLFKSKSMPCLDRQNNDEGFKQKRQN